MAWRLGASVWRNPILMTKCCEQVATLHVKVLSPIVRHKAMLPGILSTGFINHFGEYNMTTFRLQYNCKFYRNDIENVEWWL